MITRRTFKMLLLAALLVAIVPAQQALADSFDQNNIIDDVVFHSTKTMATAQINNFLNAFSGSCISPSSGFSAPDPTGYNPTNGFTYGGNVSAGQVISDAAQAYGLNPQVILTTLEKEQSLVSGSGGCSVLRYVGAMGYGCPDGGTTHSYSGLDLYSMNGTTVSSVSGTCVNSATKAGFSQQVIHASWLLKFGEERSEGNVNWNVQLTNSPQPGDSWDNSDDPQSCYGGPMTQGTWQRCPSGGSASYDGYTTIDGTAVHMDNGATASLYWYTPHFNGNQNFFNIFNSWFGSTHRVNAAIVLTQGLSITHNATVYSGDTLTASYQVSNTGSAAIDAGGLGVCARMNGQNYDFGFADSVIPGSSTVTITYSKTLDLSGSLHIFTCSYNQALGGWDSDFYPYDTDPAQPRTADLTVVDNPLVTTGLQLSPSSPSIGQSTTATFTITNASANVMDIGSMLVAGRDPNGNNVDFPIVNDVTVSANGGTYTYSQTRLFSTPGTYKFYIANWKGAWNTTFPVSANGGIARTLNVSVVDNPLVTTGLSLSPATPAIGQPTTATFTIRNMADAAINIGSMLVAGRDPNGNNVDFPIVNDVTVSGGGGTYTYSQTRTFSSVGTYKFYLANWHGGWSATYPASMSNAIFRQLNTTVLDNPLITTGLSLSPSTPGVGQNVTATFTITNADPVAINVGSLLVAGRGPNGVNVDFPTVNDVVIPANGTYTYSQTRTFTLVGSYNFFVASWKGAWSTTYPSSANGSILRTVSTTVQ